MNIKVLGGGCCKCENLLEAVKEAVAEKGIAAEIEYITDMAKIMEYGIMSTPALMLMYGKEASNRKQEIDRQHYTIPNQRPKDKHCGKI